MDIPLWLYFAKFIAIDFLIVASSWGLGYPFKRFSKDTTCGAEAFFFRVVFGLGIWVAAVFALGLTHSLYKISLEIVLAFGLLSAVAGHKSLKFRRPDWLTAGLMFAAYVPSFWYSMYPARFFDDLNYNLPIAKFFITTHSLDAAWHLRFPVCNQATQLLLVPLQAFSADIGAQQLAVVSFQLIMLGLFCCAKRFANDLKAGQLAVLACLSATHMLELSVTAYTEMNFALFTFASAYAWLISMGAKQKSLQRRWSIVAGISLGLAIGSNLFAIVALIMFTLIELYELLESMILKNNQGSAPFTNLVFMTPFALLTWAPWAIRNYFYLKNPVFPYLDKVFGLGNFWNSSDSQSYFEMLERDFGLQTTMTNWMTLPFQLSHPTDPYTEPSMFPTFAIAFVLSITLSLLPRYKTIGRLLLVITGSIIAWFCFGHEASYLTALAPSVYLLTGLTAARLWRYIKIKDSRIFAITFTTAVVLVFGGIGRTLAFLTKYNDPIPKTNGEKALLLYRWMPIFRSIDFANTLPKGILYTYKNPYINYLYRGRTSGDTFGPARYASAKQIKDSAKLYIFLRNLKVDYLLVERTDYEPLTYDRQFGDHFHVLYGDETATLYKVL